MSNDDIFIRKTREYFCMSFQTFAIQDRKLRHVEIKSNFCILTILDLKLKK